MTFKIKEIEAAKLSAIDFSLLAAFDYVKFYKDVCGSYYKIKIEEIHISIADAAIENLSERMAIVLKLYYRKVTFLRMSMMLNLSSYQLSKLRTQAIRMLKHHSRIGSGTKYFSKFERSDLKNEIIA